MTGPEVKSVKAGQISLRGSFLTVDRAGRVWLSGAHIAPYAPAKSVQISYDPTRPRQVLLNRAEIQDLAVAHHTQGLTLVPLSVYTKGRLLKVKIGIVRGKRRADKREAIKQRDLARDLKTYSATDL